MWGLFRASIFNEVYFPVSPNSAMFLGMFPIDVGDISESSKCCVEMVVPIVEINIIETRINAIERIRTIWGENLHGYNSQCFILVREISNRVAISWLIPALPRLVGWRILWGMCTGLVDGSSPFLSGLGPCIGCKWTRNVIIILLLEFWHLSSDQFVQLVGGQ